MTYRQFIRYLKLSVFAVIILLIVVDIVSCTPGKSHHHPRPSVPAPVTPAPARTIDGAILVSAP